MMGASTVSPEALSTILLIQRSLLLLSTPEEVAPLLTCGLSRLLGIKSAKVIFAKNAPLERPSEKCIVLQTPRGTYGWLNVEVSDQESYDLCVPLVENLAANAALWIENQERGEELRRISASNTRLKDALSARDLFIRLASHELKTPITTVLLLCDVLKSEVAEGRGPDPALIDRMVGTTRDLARMLDDYLSIARIETQETPHEERTVRIHELIRNRISDFALIYPRHCLSFESSSADIEILGDPSKLGEALGNLIDNAAKYTQDGGSIVIRLWESSSEGVVVSVSDSGIGIPIDQQSKIFAPRFRGRNVDSAKCSGQGLGLYITRKIVERHGGKISVKSEPGKGTTFFIKLPRIRKAALAA